MVKWSEIARASQLPDLPACANFSSRDPRLAWKNVSCLYVIQNVIFNNMREKRGNAERRELKFLVAQSMRQRFPRSVTGSAKQHVWTRHFLCNALHNCYDEGLIALEQRRRFASAPQPVAQVACINSLFFLFHSKMPLSSSPAKAAFLRTQQGLLSPPPPRQRPPGWLVPASRIREPEIAECSKNARICNILLEFFHIFFTFHKKNYFSIFVFVASVNFSICTNKSSFHNYSYKYPLFF